MDAAPSQRERRAGLANIVLVLIVVAVTTIWLMHGREHLAWSIGTYALFAVGVPLACFLAYRMTWLRVLLVLVFGGGLGYLKEALAVQGGVWAYPNGPLALDRGASFQPSGLAPLYVAFLMGFAGLGIYALAHFLDEVLRVRRRPGLDRSWASPALVLVVFATLVLLLAFEAGGHYGRAVVRYPAYLAFDLLLALLAWYFSVRARLGRVVVTMVAAVLASAVGLQLGVVDRLWEFAPNRPPLFLILGDWPLAFFVQYSLAAVLSERAEAWWRRRKRLVEAAERAARAELRAVQAQRRDIETEVRGALDKMVLWTAPPAENLLGLVLYTALGLFTFMGPASGTRPGSALPSWFYLLLPVALYLIALYAVHSPMHRLRVYWLLALGALLGWAVEASHLWLRPAPQSGYAYTIPVWALLAVSAYGLAAWLARIWSRRRDSPEWRWVDRGGAPAGVVCAVVMAVVGVTWLLVRGTAPAADWAVGAVVWALFTGAAVSISAQSGLAAGLPLALLLLGYLLSNGAFRMPAQAITGLFFAGLAAYLADRAVRELHSRTAVAMIVSSWIFGSLALGTALALHFVSSFPWFFAFGLGPLVLSACFLLSASAAGERVNKRPVRGPHYLDTEFEPEPAALPGRSAVAVAWPDPGQNLPPPRRATHCLEEALRLLATELGWNGGGSPIREFVRPHEKVFVKPNVVLPLYSPCIVRPELVRDVARLCVENAGAAKVRIGETSLSEFTARQTLVETGLREYWEQVDQGRVEVTLLDESGYCPLPPQSDFRNYFHSFSQWLTRAECDTYINISKLKTHYITDVTLAVKNALGLILDEEKRLEHAGIAGDARLAKKLVMITKARRPDLVIIDGFDALEGDGPFIGDRVDTEFIIASNDPVAADAVGATLMGFDKNTIDTCTLGAAQGIGRDQWPDITIVTPQGRVTPPRLMDLLGRAFKRPEPPLMGDDWIGPIHLLAQDLHHEHAGPESTLYGVLSFLRPFAEVYLKGEGRKLQGLTIVYGALDRPVECEAALLFGERAIDSQHLVYAPVVWQVRGEIPNAFLQGFEDIAYAADADVIKLLVTALRKSKGDYL